MVNASTPMQVNGRRRLPIGATKDILATYLDCVNPTDAFGETSLLRQNATNNQSAAHKNDTPRTLAEAEGGSMTHKTDRTSTAERARALLEVLEQSADTDYIGEPISQLEHALQAAHLARTAGATDSVILAALFHDVGHLIDAAAPQMDGLGTLNHEKIGATWLLNHGVSKAVADLVESHVAAKRYLCSRNPSYYDRLSSASKGTLAFQGGPMTETEKNAFEQRVDFKDSLALRAWDERAKDPNAQVPSLQSYITMLKKNLDAGDRYA